MIEIYHRVAGKDRLVRTFNTIEDLFRVANETELAHFGYNPTDRTTHHRIFEVVPANYLINFIISNSRCAYVAYENGNLITPDRLVGLFRTYWDTRRSTLLRKYRRHPGAKRRLGSYFRRIHTTPERRWAHAWDDEEFAPKNGFARGRRSNKSLPNSWDDYPKSRVGKSWKAQSKRKHQWK